jgi:hypothetical protein
MGNTTSATTASKLQELAMTVPRDHFIIDRLIAPTITVGITKSNNPENPLSNQGIRFKEKGDIHRLQSFREYSNCLEYTFEKDVSMTLCKMNNNNVVFTLKTPESGATIEVMNPRIQKFYKPISMHSNELDQLEKIMK